MSMVMIISSCNRRSERAAALLRRLPVLSSLRRSLPQYPHGIHNETKRSH